MRVRVAGLLTRLRWAITLPIIADVELFLTWGSHPHGLAVVLIAALIAGAVLAAVHHAEVVAHRVGEPLGSLLLAVAVTAIEVGLIVALMVSGGSATETLARDTVFSAVMICLNGIAGLALLVGAVRQRLAVFNPEGTGAALAAVSTVAVLCLVLPRFTTSHPGPVFTGAQLAFAALASLGVYVLFVFTQTGRYRDFFLPVDADGAIQETSGEAHAAPPGRPSAVISGIVLLLALVAVVGLAKVESGAIKDGVHALGLPETVVGVIIALLVLLPESLAAFRQARADRVQVSLNLAYGSAMASIGLTIPAIALASRWIDGPLVLGLDPTQVALLAITVVVSVLTVVPGRAKTLHGGLHLVLLASFLFLAASP